MIPAALLACALNVSPVTLEAVIRVESGGNSLALHVNGLRTQPVPAASAPEAARVAQAYIQRGYSVDLGLMQVNNRNLPALGLTIEQVLEPCANIRAGGTILTVNYARATQAYGEGQRALKAALSAYNTGDFARGVANGYVARYYGQTVPALHVQLVAKGEQPAPFPNRPVTSYVTARGGGLPEGFNLWIE